MRRVIFHYLLYVCTIFLCTERPIKAEELINVIIGSDSSGTGYEIMYELIDDDPGAFFEITIRVTEDYGETYIIPQTVSGDYGVGITPGAGKYIHWDAEKDLDKPLSDEAGMEINSKRIDASEIGSLTVDGQPPEAQVFLGEKYIGQSPIENKKLLLGDYVLKILHEDYEDDVENITIESQQTKEKNYSLTPKFGHITIDGSPKGAEVYLNGEKYGETPIVTKKINKGLYTIKITKQRYVDFETTEEVLPFVPAKISYNLEIIKYGYVSFSGKPEKAIVFLNGKKVGETPIINKELLFGHYKVKVKISGFEPYKAPLQVVKGENVEFPYELILKTKKKAIHKSLIFAGSGQRYFEYHQKGNLMTSLQILSFVGIVFSYMNAEDATNEYNDVKTIYDNVEDTEEADYAWKNVKSQYNAAKSASTMTIAAIGAAAGIYLWNVIDVYRLQPTIKSNQVSELIEINPNIEKGHFNITANIRF